jgi:hypothetical protein
VIGHRPAGRCGAGRVGWDRPSRRTVSGMSSPDEQTRPRTRTWDVVDHALERRARLQDLRSGRRGVLEVCDASPYLQRAAKEWGLRTTRPCPVCHDAPVWEISWVFGEALGDGDGTARSQRGVELLARRRPGFQVYEVEVCQRCGWNHLLRTYCTGTPGTEPARRSRERPAW